MVYFNRNDLPGKRQDMDLVSLSQALLALMQAQCATDLLSYLQMSLHLSQDCLCLIDIVSGHQFALHDCKGHVGAGSEVVVTDWRQ